jgi:hypothetical protein
MRRKSAAAWLLMLCAATPLAAQDPPESLASFSNVMREIGYRLANSYWAANGGNWGLARYQLHKLRLAEDAAKLENANHRKMLAAFEEQYSAPLAAAVLRKDLPRFNGDFAKAIEGCNDCHAKSGLTFLHYQMPEASGTGAFLDFTLQTDPGEEPGKR